MTESTGFLSRWSRLKSLARQSARGGGAIEGAVEESRVASEGEFPASEPSDYNATAELSEQELSLLPRIEELTIDTDLKQFMRKGVPAILRNAALRRMWSLDPAIRDYVSEAREYAYDWNVPDGIPGFGPLLPTADLGSAVHLTNNEYQRSIEDSPAVTVASPQQSLTNINDGSIDSAAPHDVTSEQLRIAEQTPVNEIEGSKGASDDSRASPVKRNNDDNRLRRHGGAVPT